MELAWNGGTENPKKIHTFLTKDALITILSKTCLKGFDATKK
jgi:hypothetical protein